MKTQNELKTQLTILLSSAIDSLEQYESRLFMSKLSTADLQAVQHEGMALACEIQTKTVGQEDLIKVTLYIHQVMLYIKTLDTMLILSSLKKGYNMNDYKFLKNLN